MGLVIIVLISLFLASSLSSPKYEYFLRCVFLLFIFLIFLPFPLEFYSFFYFYFFIYDRHTVREREAETQAEGEAGPVHREPDVGLDPGSPGSRPGPKAGAKPLRHPGIPRTAILRTG